MLNSHQTHKIKHILRFIQTDLCPNVPTLDQLAISDVLMFLKAKAPYAKKASPATRNVANAMSAVGLRKPNGQGIGSW
ncbi:hypothetical protein TNCV_1433311 [Trichonephila clavipes]|nr:hypothetical protein TNCV_1433311 [Trichonephila clavipes]